MDYMFKLPTLNAGRWRIKKIALRINHNEHLPLATLIPPVSTESSAWQKHKTQGTNVIHVTKCQTASVLETAQMWKKT